MDANPSKQKPRSHVISEVAVTEAILVCKRVGWGVVENSSDYGEDLIVQTIRDTATDPFRTLIQVRAKEEVSTLGDERWALSVSREDLLPWLRLREPFLVLVWDAKSGTGRFTIPRDEHRYVEVLSSKEATLTLHFQVENAWHEERLPRLAWELRLGTYHRDALLLSFAEAHLDEAYAESAGLRFFDPSLGVQLLNDLDFMQNGVPILEVQEQLNMAKNERDRSQDDMFVRFGSPEDSVMFQAAIAIVSKRIQDFTGRAASSSLCDFAALALLSLHLGRSPDIED